MTEATVVAIDGPAGVGKSTVARTLAARLGLNYLDTGAMYRAVALAARRRGLDPDDAAAVAELLAAMDLTLHPDDRGVAEVRLDGDSVEPAIREPEVGLLASSLAARPEVRARLVTLQRAFGRRHGAVMEGRDIGTVVFPHTPHKFFLDARPEVRARRRRDQLQLAGQAVDAEAVSAELTERDRRDTQRDSSPLQLEDSYHLVDTSDLPIDEVVERILGRVRGG